MPYLLLLPGLLWIAIFYVVPIARLVGVSLQEGVYPDYSFNWVFENYTRAFSEFGAQLGRSILYGLTATAVAILIAYPLAYGIAFRGGRFKNLFLVLLLMPFLMPFLLRTLSWKIILADNGFVVVAMKSLGLIAEDGRLLATGIAVVSGLIYAFLPFATLPIYVSLEKIDRSLLEAAQDLYANPATAFWKVTWPLSLPGVVAASLLTLIPAAGDYINAQLLGNPQTTMIGNVIQTRFLTVLDFPLAAALSFTLMAVILVLIFIYVRATGTEELI